MGHLAWFCVGISVFAALRVEAAQAPATATFPPARSSAAAASSAASPGLPLPPPPPPPAASPAPPAAPTEPAPAPAPAPSPAPAPAAPPSAATSAAAPPATYPQPYPGYASYPPPGYGYYYPPPMPRVQERFPETAAVSSVPFIDMLVASVSWQNRFSEFLNVGLQAGTYVAGRVRLSANLLLPTSPLNDDYYASYVATNTSSGSGYYSGQPSKAASLLYGVTAGIVAVSSSTFVLSPGVAFSRTDVSDYGSSLAFSLPFEWVTGNGMRVGLEFDAGRAFGGRLRAQCYSNFGGIDTSCSSGPTLTQDRPVGTSILLQFQLGFGFNHPDPLPPRTVPNAAPYGWPPAPQAAPLAPAPPPAAAPAAPAPAP